MSGGSTWRVARKQVPTCRRQRLLRCNALPRTMVNPFLLPKVVGKRILHLAANCTQNGAISSPKLWRGNCNNPGRLENFRLSASSFLALGYPDASCSNCPDCSASLRLCCHRSSGSRLNGVRALGCRVPQRLGSLACGQASKSSEPQSPSLYPSQDLGVDQAEAGGKATRNPGAPSWAQDDARRDAAQV